MFTNTLYWWHQIQKGVMCENGNVTYTQTGESKNIEANSTAQSVKQSLHAQATRAKTESMSKSKHMQHWKGHDKYLTDSGVSVRLLNIN